jgi:hypothetical protein
MSQGSIYVLRCIQLFALVLTLCAVTSRAQTTSFTYQGKLSDGGGPATGAYDFQFTLWDALSGGTQQPQPSPVTVTKTNVAVSGGVFTVQLDFGATAFPGADRFLEIGVQLAGGSGFTILTPRQAITSTPYSLRSLTTTAADALSAACVNCVTSGQIQSVQGSQISSQIPVADVPAGSANYIQNSTNQQAASNFSISGNGTATILNATTQYNLGGQRMLSVSGPFSAGVTATASNTFLGENAGVNTMPSGTINDPGGKFNTFMGSLAGVANTTGANNAFFGGAAGNANTNGSQNSFFGDSAGRFNTTGDNNTFSGGFAGFRNTTQHDNTFIGYEAGSTNGTNDTTTLANFNTFVGAAAGNSNTSGSGNIFAGASAGQFNTLGIHNSFLGANTGNTNTQGSENSLLGFSADLGPNGLTNATAIGSHAFVSQSNSIVLGSINGTNGATANTMVGIGTTTPGTALDVQNNSASATIRAKSTAGSGVLYLDRASAIASNSSQIGFLSAGNPDFTIGTSQGSAGISDFSIYNYGTGSNVFTIQKSNGNVGIGTVTPGYRLHIDQTTPSAFATHIQTEGLATGTSYGLVVSAGTNSSDISFQSRNQAGSSMFMVRGDGLVNIANTLGVTGSASIGSNLTLGGGLQLQNMIGPGGLSVCVNSSGPPYVLVVCSSSYRYKTNIINFRNGLSIINRLKPIEYAWKIGGQRDIGFGAEDVENIDRRLVFYNDKGQVEGVKYDRIGVVLVNAVKEQQAQIEKQQEQIKLQEDQAKRQRAAFAAQQQQIDALKKLVCRRHSRAAVCR